MAPNIARRMIRRRRFGAPPEVHPVVHETFIVSSRSVRGECWSISSLLTTMPESTSEAIPKWNDLFVALRVQLKVAKSRYARSLCASGRVSGDPS